MAQPSDLEARLTALEARVGELAADTRTAREDAAAARHLAAARDRDIADLAVKVDANRSAINALGEQTRERFDAVDRRFDAVDRRFDALERKVDNGFTEIRGKFDATATGLNQITGLLTTLIDQQGNQPGNNQS
jgi:chromosome segregation ATPase